MNQPKRILIFSLAYYPDLVGGAEVAVKEIADRINPGDFEFHMVTLRTKSDQAADERMGNVVVHRIGSPAQKGFLFALNKYLFPFMAYFEAKRLHKRLSFDASWSIMASFSGFAALFFKLHYPNTPLLLTLQEGDPIEYIKTEAFKIKIGRLRIPVRFLAYPLFQMIFKHADRIQAISKYLAEFGSSMGALCEKVVVPNGVDVAGFSKGVDPSELASVREKIGKREGEVFLVTASRLVVKNAVGDCISALAHLDARVKLLVLGKGDLESELKEKAKALGVEGRVVFEGYVGHESLPKYLKASDIFIRPSLSEGFGNSFIEAMAAKIPVIATPVGGIVDFLKDKETGLFCEVSNPEDIARKVGVYLHDRNLKDEIVDNAFSMVSKKYDWNLVAKVMKEEAFQPLFRKA